MIDDQHAASFDGTRSNKLARKAESARQARLRHKAYVTDLQEQVESRDVQVGRRQEFFVQAFRKKAGHSDGVAY